jgi:hypothetical protein
MAVLSASQLTYAQPVITQQTCSEYLIRAVGTFVGVDNLAFPSTASATTDRSSEVIIAGACKTSPTHNHIVIIALAYGDEHASEHSLVIALVDTNTNKVISSFKSGTLDFAAFGIAANGLRIDTAPYNLAPGVRAFGLDVTERYNPGCGEGGRGPSRTLFVQSGSILRPVLANFTMSSWVFIKGGNPRCVGEEASQINQIEKTKSSISIGRATTNDYANLMISEISTQPNGKKNKQKISRYELRYDGNQYSNQPRKRMPHEKN